MIITAAEKKVLELEDSIIGAKLKVLFEKILNNTPLRENMETEFSACYSEMTIFFNGTLAEAMSLLKKYQAMTIRCEPELPIKIFSEDTRITLTDKSKVNDREKELEIEVRTGDIKKTQKLMSVIAACLGGKKS
jgi:hypothetical protein